MVCGGGTGVIELLLLRRLHLLRRRRDGAATQPRRQLLLLLSAELTVSYTSTLSVYDYNVVSIKNYHLCVIVLQYCWAYNAPGNVVLELNSVVLIQLAAGCL
jgi:hypothetical protein